MRYFILLLILLFIVSSAIAQDDYELQDQHSSLYDIAPRWIVDMPTAGTLDKGQYQIGFRNYPEGGVITYTDIGLSNRFTLGIAYGGNKIISNDSPDWNPKIEFNIKFRFIDEVDYFPAFSTGFTSQGSGAWSDDDDRYEFKSRGFYGVFSRSFYFYNWTSGWHFGINYSLENDVDNDKSLNLYGGVDATFKYNLALLLEYDAALNDNKDYDFSGKGRGYLNISIKWLFNDNLELEALLKDLLVNRKSVRTFTREFRLTYMDNF